MTPVRFDGTAREIIAARLANHPDAALRFELKTTYGRGTAYHFPFLNWTTADRAARERGLARVSAANGLALYIEPRLLRYWMWHPVSVRGQRFGPFSRLLPSIPPLFMDALRRWEAQHPAIALSSSAVA